MTDQEAIEAVVQNYRDGLFTSNTELMNSVFAPDAIVSGYFGERWGTIDAVSFVERVCSAEKTVEENGCDFRCVVDSVDITGNTAQCRFSEYDDNGMDFVTYFNLAKLEGTWKVVSKLYTTV